MEYVTLGKTGLKVSRVGLGGIPIQRIDAQAAKKLLDAVEAAGINYIDSARGYSVSEELIGGAIEGRRDRFVLATKTMSRDREAMARDIETSLKNFRTDYIDLYQVHNPSLKQLEQICAPGGALEALLEAREAGKIGHIGLTAHAPEVFERALELDWVETVMFPYNIVETQAAELMERARERNVGFINMKPLAGGAIEDAKLAIRFAAANPNVDVVLPGMYAPEEVEENGSAAADSSPLTVEELERVEAMRRELGTSFCRPLHSGYRHPQSVRLSRLSQPLRSGGLGQGPVWGPERPRVGLCGVRRLRGAVPLPAAHPEDAENGGGGLWHVEPVFTGVERHPAGCAPGIDRSQTKWYS